MASTNGSCAATRAFSTFGFRDGKLAVVESVNRAGDHAAAKRIIGTTKTLTPAEAADPAFDLRGLAKRWSSPRTSLRGSVASQAFGVEASPTRYLTA
jgi:hypothetical protein